jgi:hypothetical protein
MRAKWRSCLSACSSALEKCLTRADIVRDAILRQLYAVFIHESQIERSIGAFLLGRWGVVIVSHKK